MGCWIVPIVIKVVRGFKVPQFFAVVQCAAAFFVGGVVPSVVKVLKVLLKPFFVIVIAVIEKCVIFAT